MVSHKAIMALVLTVVTAASVMSIVASAAVAHWFTVMSKGSSSAVIAGVANIGDNVYVLNTTYSGNYFSIVNMTADHGEVKGIYKYGLRASSIDYIPGESTIYVGIVGDEYKGILVAELQTLESSQVATIYTPYYEGGSTNPVKAVAVTNTFIVAALEPGGGDALIAILYRADPQATEKGTFYRVTLTTSAPLHLTDIDAVELGTGPDKLVIAVAGTYPSSLPGAYKEGIIGVVELDISSGSFPDQSTAHTFVTKTIYGNYPIGVFVSGDGQYVYAVATDDSPGSIIFKYSVTDETLSKTVLVTGAGTQSSPLLTDIREAGNGYLYAVGTALGPSTSTPDNDAIIMELSTDLEPERAWIIGGNDVETVNSSSAMDVASYVFLGGSTLSFRDGDVSAPFVMLFSPGLTNESRYRWTASTGAPPISDPSDGPEVLLTTRIDSLTVSGPSLGTATLTKVSIESVGSGTVRLTYSSWGYYTAESGEEPLPVPEPWTVAIAIAGIVGVLYVLMMRRQ